jgi:putative glutamine amidotransferase
MRNLHYLKRLTLLFLLLIAHTWLAAQHKVVLTKPSETYINWLKFHDATLIIASLYGLPKSEWEKVLQGAAGVVITGGEDIQPEWYGKATEKALCQKPDPYRDTLEMFAFKYAEKAHIPILGICRGHQFINVARGGTLITDIPTKVKKPAIHFKDSDKGIMHTIEVVPGAVLSKWSNKFELDVNSFHHQCAEKEGEGIVFTARCKKDGVVESLEWRDDDGNVKALGVQFHPERMAYDHPYSIAPAKWFLQALENRK